MFYARRNLKKLLRRGAMFAGRRVGIVDPEREYLDASHRRDVGPVKRYDVMGAMQFNILVSLGLRDTHRLLDFGCGSLRGGRLFIPYLNAGLYAGVEPHVGLVEAGLQQELGYPPGWYGPKRPQFYYFDDFMISRHVPGQFDYVLAQSILSHAGEDVAETIIREVAAVLKPGGTFVATFFEGHAPRQQGWLGKGITAYPLSWISEIAAKHGLDCQRLRIKHPAGQTWVVMRTKQK